MKIYFLLYMEDTSAGNQTHVELFLKELSAQKAMETEYAETIRRLRFDDSAYSEDHCCSCGKSTAIITNGQDNYSWSVGVREMTAPTDVPSLPANGGGTYV